MTLLYFTFYLHCIYTTCTLYLHYIYITFTLHLQYIYITVTLNLHYIYIAFTVHSHYIHIPSRHITSRTSHHTHTYLCTYLRAVPAYIHTYICALTYMCIYIYITCIYMYKHIYYLCICLKYLTCAALRPPPDAPTGLLCSRPRCGIFLAGTCCIKFWGSLGICRFL